MSRGRMLGALALLAAAAVTPWTGHVQAQPRSEPVLHEFLPLDTREDLSLSSTSPGGALPAAIQTPSGTIRPPDMRRSPPPGQIYHQGASDGGGFQPDRDTRRPHVEHYDDPFSPALTPFKRLYAFDAVRDDYSLYVRDPEPRRVAVGGTANEGDERFFGDMQVRLSPGERVRIPTVGPGARLVSLVVAPEQDVSVWRDSAGNWFAQGAQPGQARLVSEIAIHRDVFGSQFADVPWGALPAVPLQPAAHRASFRKVAKAIGITRQMAPREALFEMVGYFRSFAPSEQLPEAQDDIYLDLALTKKGVCRHRAFAFLVTSLNLGIPARFVHNEAHAWVEVNDGRMWHRIDLGGAALDLEQPDSLDRPPHRPPPDPYAWPTGRDSGQELADRTRAEQEKKRDPNSSDPGSSDPNGSDPGSGPGNGSGTDPDGSTPSPSSGPLTKMTIDRVDHDLFRGMAISLMGTARSEGQPCRRLRVDVLMVVAGESAERVLGSLSTDDDGVFRGTVVLPPDIPIGDHDLVVATGGNKRCGAGQAR